MGNPEPNTALVRLYHEARWGSLREFAQAVNRVATERGTPLTYQPPSVHQWLSGRMPKPAAQPVILEALARRIGRPITHADAGFPAPKDGPSTQPRTVEELADLGKTDMEPSRRGVIGAGLFSVALTIPNWPDIVGRMEAAQNGTMQRVGMGEVGVVSAMTDRLSELDDEFGGRHARPMAAAFMVNTVVPYLRASAPDAVRQAMMGAASFLSYLTGWMAVDEGLHGLAQRYYVRGLELAGASQDYMTYCHILRGMSVQAADLGHGAPAVRQADAAADVAPSAEPRMRAFMAGQQAHAYALQGNRREAFKLMAETERAMDKAESQAKTFGGYSPATVAYHEAQVRYALGDTAGSVTALKRHFRLRVPANESRRGGIRFMALLAERQLQVGHLEAACASWGRVLEDHATVQSGRVDERVTTMFRDLRPYLSNALARDLYERGRSIVPAALVA